MDGAVTLMSVHGKFLSAQPDGRAEWNRVHASDWEYFHLEKRHNAKIALKGHHGMYVSAQPDGSVQINRRWAPPGGWEEFAVEDRGNGIICLKSCHGKYLSAQQNGTAQWNRDHAPRGGWEDIQMVHQSGTSQRESAIQTSTRLSVTQATNGIEILEALPGKPVRFKINNPPSSNNAWVGIYPFGIVNEDHGKEGERWKWLRDVDVNDASFSVRLGSKASIRVFSDGGHTLHNRVDFEIVPSKKGWWEA